MVVAASIFKACLLGVVQGVAEFLPISSSAHVFLVSCLVGGLGAHTKSKLIFLQGMSILAAVRFYWPNLSLLVTDCFRNSTNSCCGPHNNCVACNGIRGVILGTLPFLVVGFLGHKFVVKYLFSPMVISACLALGGIVLIVVNHFWQIAEQRSSDLKYSWLQIGPKQSLAIGLIQIVAILPGVSRSGATIVGGFFCGMKKFLAVEYSFFLAIPLLLAVSAFQLWSIKTALTSDEWIVMIVAAMVTFWVSCAVIKALIFFLSYNKNSLFWVGLYRIFLGAIIFFLAFFHRLV